MNDELPLPNVMKRVQFSCYRAGVANKSIAIDRSIAEAQLVDRAWFYIEMTR